jgi:hypothetical protein
MKFKLEIYCIDVGLFLQRFEFGGNEAGDDTFLKFLMFYYVLMSYSITYWLINGCLPLLITIVLKTVSITPSNEWWNVF